MPPALAIDVPASAARETGNFDREPAFFWPVGVASGDLDRVLFDRLRKSSTGRVVPTAQLVQVPLAVGVCTRPYWAAEQGAGQDVHTTVPGSQQPAADANAAGLFLLVVGADSYSTYNLPQDGSVT